MKLLLPDREIHFPRRALVMGIVNINADSFSGDGTLDVNEALVRAAAMAEAGADIIDVGGESARTNREPISENEEINRVVPFIAKWKARCESGEIQARDPGQVWPPVLSINTWRPLVAEATLAAGGELLNDMSALPDSVNALIAARFRAALLIMHSIGLPKQRHTHVGYDDVWSALLEFFRDRLQLAKHAGLHDEATLLDPGIDFAKQRDDNLAVYRELPRLHEFKRPILLPVSRKTVIGDVLGISEPSRRDAGTVASLIAGLDAGAQIFRVHDVRAAYEAIRMWESVQRCEVANGVG